MDWYYREGDRQIGPITDEVFQALLKASAITSETPVWRKGWDDWRKAGSASIVTPDPATVQKLPRYMSADEIRHPQELMALFISLGFILICPVVIFLLADESIYVGLIGSVLGIVSLMLTAAIGTKIHQNILLGSCVRVTSEHFPDIHKLCREAAERLGMPLPDLYIQQGYALNAYAIGPFKSKTIVITSTLAANASPAELQFIVGHELTHIKCRHTFWLSIVGGGPDEGSQGIPGLSFAFRAMFLRWSRMAEYTCDCGGYIACNDIGASINALCKLMVGPELMGKINLNEITAQRKVIDDKPLVQLCEWAFADHPFTINRIHAVANFAAKHKSAGLGASSNE